MHPGNINHLVTRGAIRKNFYHIPNGVNIDDWNNKIKLPKKLITKIKDIKKTKKKIILYAGTISIANDIKFQLIHLRKPKKLLNI